MRYFSIKFYVLLPVMLFMTVFGVGCSTAPIESTSSNGDINTTIDSTENSNVDISKNSSLESDINENIGLNDITLNYKRFNSIKDAGIKYEFSFLYPDNLIHFGSFDGGYGSKIPFFDEIQYRATCEVVNIQPHRCSTGKIFEATILTPNGYFTEARYDNEVSENININGYQGSIQAGYINANLDETAHLGTDGQKEKRLILNIFNNSQLGIVMLIQSDSDEEIFNTIVKSLEIIAPQ